MDPISSVSHVILTRVSTRVFAYKNSCHRYIRKIKTVGGLKKYIWRLFYCPHLIEGEFTNLLPTGIEEKGVVWVGNIPVAILPSCPDMKTSAL